MVAYWSSTAGLGPGRGGGITAPEPFHGTLRQDRVLKTRTVTARGYAPAFAAGGACEVADASTRVSSRLPPNAWREVTQRDSRWHESLVTDMRTARGTREQNANGSTGVSPQLDGHANGDVLLRFKDGNSR